MGSTSLEIKLGSCCFESRNRTAGCGGPGGAETAERVEIWIRSGCCLLWYPGGGHGHGVEFRGAGEERDRYRAGRGRGGKIVRVKNKMRKETKKSLGSRSVSRAQTAKCSPRLINSFSPPAHRTRRGRSGVCILLVIPRGPAFYRAPSQLSVACAFRSELRSHAKEGGCEAPRALVRSSFIGPPLSSLLRVPSGASSGVTPRRGDGRRHELGCVVASVT